MKMRRLKMNLQEYGAKVTSELAEVFFPYE